MFLTNSASDSLFAQAPAALKLPIRGSIDSCLGSFGTLLSRSIHYTEKAAEVSRPCDDILFLFILVSSRSELISLSAPTPTFCLGCRISGAALHNTDRSCACPGHAFQKSPLINSVMVVVVLKFVLFVLGHTCAPYLRSFLPFSTICPCHWDLRRGLFGGRPRRQ